MMYVRQGVLGSWDRFVGPEASTVENAGTLGLASAGAVLAPRLSARGGRGSRLMLAALAFDMWGGAWSNNTPSSVRWYERDGQGVREHVMFAALHVHPFLVARLDRGTGRVPPWAWAGLQYGYVIAATIAVARLSGARRRAAGVLVTAGGVALDRLLGGSAAAPWFGPVYYVKLLCGHAAGGALTPGSRQP